jgi:hypothetical protein
MKLQLSPYGHIHAPIVYILQRAHTNTWCLVQSIYRQIKLGATSSDYTRGQYETWSDPQLFLLSCVHLAFLLLLICEN